MSQSIPVFWHWREVKLDRAGYDEFGWFWGNFAPNKLWWCSDGVDSITVKALTGTLAHALVVAENGWPPKIVGRFNHGREYER